MILNKVHTINNRQYISFKIPKELVSEVDVNEYFPEKLIKEFGICKDEDKYRLSYKRIVSINEENFKTKTKEILRDLFLKLSSIDLSKLESFNLLSYFPMNSKYYGNYYSIDIDPLVYDLKLGASYRSLKGIKLKLFVTCGITVKDSFSSSYSNSSKIKIKKLETFKTEDLLNKVVDNFYTLINSKLNIKYSLAPLDTKEENYAKGILKNNIATFDVTDLDGFTEGSEKIIIKEDMYNYYSIRNKNQDKYQTPIELIEFKTTLLGRLEEFIKNYLINHGTRLKYTKHYIFNYKRYKIRFSIDKYQTNLVQSGTLSFKISYEGSRKYSCDRCYVNLSSTSFNIQEHPRLYQSIISKINSLNKKLGLGEF